MQLQTLYKYKVKIVHILVGCTYIRLWICRGLLDHDNICTPYEYMNNFYLIFIEMSATAYGRDIIHIYLLYMFHVVTVIILFCKHWGSHSAFHFQNIWTYVL